MSTPRRHGDDRFRFFFCSRRLNVAPADDSGVNRGKVLRLRPLAVWAMPYRLEKPQRGNYVALGGVDGSSGRPGVSFGNVNFRKSGNRRGLRHVHLHEPVEGLGAGIELVAEMFTLRSHCPRSPRHSLQAPHQPGLQKHATKRCEMLMSDVSDINAPVKVIFLPDLHLREAFPGVALTIVNT